VPHHKATTPPKRLRILEDEELTALYGRPAFTPEDRVHVFALTQPEHEALQLFGHLHTQLFFLLQLAYFKANQQFFVFTLDDVADDVEYVLTQFFAPAARPTVTQISKPTLLKQHALILHLCTYRLCTATDREHMRLRALRAAKISSQPIYVFRDLLQYVSEQRLVAPGYTVLQDMVSQALTAEEQRLTTILQSQVSAQDRVALDRLFDDSQGLYVITQLKQEPKDFSRGEMRREVARGDVLRPLYHLATRILPQLAISNEGIKEYAALVAYYSVFRLKQLDLWMVYLYLLCFVLHRY
jgi:hypothetical protein